jgi:putative ABC transport system permease protein
MLHRRARRLHFSANSWLNYRDLRDHSQSFTTMSLYANDVTVVESKDSSLSVSAPRVTPNTFSMLGIQPLLGRTFTEAEGQPGGPPVVLLSEGLWRQSFNADREVVGRTLRIGGVARTVIGVMPEAMRFPEEVGPEIRNAVWLPLQPTPEMLKERGYSFSVS